MSYEMECPRCGQAMTYIKDKTLEELGFVSMECPNKCENGYLVPCDNPELKEV